MSNDRGRKDPIATARRGRSVEDRERRKKLGDRIRSARSERGLSQAQLSKAMGVTPGAVGQWEIGESSPATEKLDQLASILDVSVDELFGRSQPAASPGFIAGAAADDLQLIDEARRLGVDLKQIVAEARQQRWRQENKDALADANAFLIRYGLWSDGKRQF